MEQGIMSKQLELFPTVSDSESVSLTLSVSDTLLNESLIGETPKTALVRKQQAIQRFLDRGTAKDHKASVNKYYPGRRATPYYRLSYRLGRKVKHIHIKGGNAYSPLAIYRADQLRELIDRGAELAEVLAMVATFNGA
jgi:hypothetical protein